MNNNGDKLNLWLDTEASLGSVSQALGVRRSAQVNSYMEEMINDATKAREIELMKKLYNSFSVNPCNEISSIWDIDVEPPSVLETSAIGQNLHQLLEEKSHPLTDTALAYIRELERKLERKEEDIEYYKTELKKWDKKKTDLHKEVKQLKAQLNHPARRGRK